MFYFVRFLIIYLLFSDASMATKDFDEYYGDDNYDDIDDYSKLVVNRRKVDPPKNIPQNFIGSNLFGSGIFVKKCFSVEDVALLSTRWKFEKIMPNITISMKKLEDDKSVEVMMEYLYGLNDILNIIKKDDIQYFSQQAFYDVVGGYLHYYYWPLVKYSYYAGMLTYNITINVYNLHKQSKEFLNTIGNGWRHSIDFFPMKFNIEPVNASSNLKPLNHIPLLANHSRGRRDFTGERFFTTYNITINVYNLHKQSKEFLNTIGNGWRHSIDFFPMKFNIEPVNASSKDGEAIQVITGKSNPCESLLLITDEDYTDRYETELIVSLPKIDTENSDGMLNVRLPFKRIQNYNLNSKGSAFILLKYYVTVTQCYAFRKEIPDRFDRRFQKLMKEKFLPFLQSDDFYPGFGAILRISETLNRRMIVSRNADENYAENFLQHSGVVNKSYDSSDDKRQENNSTVFGNVINSLTSLESDNWDDNKKMELLFFVLVAIVVFLTILILCCCILLKSKMKSNTKNSNESKPKGNSNCFNIFKRFKKKPEHLSKSSVHEFDIGPRSSSILHGNDFEDTECRISSQTSGLSLKDLIHAEISKKPSKPSRQQINAMSRTSIKMQSVTKEPEERK